MANKFTAFTFGSDSYVVFEDNTTDGFNATDNDALIKVTGVTGLAIGTAATSDIIVA